MFYNVQANFINQSRTVSPSVDLQFIGVLALGS